MSKLLQIVKLIAKLRRSIKSKHVRLLIFVGTVFVNVTESKPIGPKDLTHL